MVGKKEGDGKFLSVATVLTMTLVLLTGMVTAPISATASELVEGAKKEGEIVYFSNVIGTDTNAALVKAFKKSYGLPGSFQVKHSLIKSGALVSKVNTELKAGFTTVDIISASVPTFLYSLKEKGELMEYHSPEHKYYEAVLKSQIITGEPGYWVSPNAYTFVLMWNPKFIKQDLVSWKDVLNSDYKGKVVMGDVMKSNTYAQSYIALRKKLDRQFFERLAQQKPFFVVSSEAIADHVATGEYPVAFFGMPTRAYQRAKIGINLKVAYPPEGAMLLGQPFAILTKAPHPNAAKLWIDFIFGEEAQMIHLEHEGLSPARKGMKGPELVSRFTPSVETINGLPLDWKAISKKDIQDARKEFREVFKR